MWADLFVVGEKNYENTKKQQNSIEKFGVESRGSDHQNVVGVVKYNEDKRFKW